MGATVQVEEQIEKLLMDFNFAKVHSVMKHFGWTLNGKVPSVDELKTKARELLNKLDLTATDGYVSEGGLRAYMRRGRRIGLSFEITNDVVNCFERIPHPHKS